MLPSASSLSNAILALPPTTDKMAGVTALVGVIADHMNQVQAGPTGSPGIFTLGNSAMVAILVTQDPVPDNSWNSKFADAWEAGVMAGSITASTVSDATTWVGSTTDIDTVTSPSATIATIAAGKSTLLSGLNSVSATNNPAMPLAQAIHDATLKFKFTCIGENAVPAQVSVTIAAK